MAKFKTICSLAQYFESQNLKLSDDKNNMRQKIDAAMYDIRAISYPFDRFLVFDHGVVLVEIVPVYGEGKLHLSSILSGDPGKGRATATMKKIHTIADRHGVSIDLFPKPFGYLKGALNKKQLVSWYERLGYKKDRDGTMHRGPVDSSSR